MIVVMKNYYNKYNKINEEFINVIRFVKNRYNKITNKVLIIIKLVRVYLKDYLIVIFFVKFLVK